MMAGRKPERDPLFPSVSRKERLTRTTTASKVHDEFRAGLHHKHAVDPKNPQPKRK